MVSPVCLHYIQLAICGHLQSRYYSVIKLCGHYWTVCFVCLEIYDVI